LRLPELGFQLQLMGHVAFDGHEVGGFARRVADGRDGGVLLAERAGLALRR
jgi:hypothetical protein